MKIGNSSIGFVCQEYPPRKHGGLGTFVRNLAAALVEMDVSVVVFEAGELEEGANTREDCGVEVVTLPIAGRRGLGGQILRCREFGLMVSRQAIERGCEYLEINESGGWGAFVRGTPVLVRLHNARVLEVPVKHRGRGTWLLENLALRQADRVVGVSSYICQVAKSYYRLAGLGRRNIRVIPNGVRGRDFPVVGYERRESGTIVFVGTLKPVKGLDRLIQAIDLIGDRFPRLKLEVYGQDTVVDGRPYSELLKETLPVNTRVWSRVNFRGPVDHQDVAGILGRMWVCVIPSAFEAMVTVALEAMATGTAVVAGPFDSVSEVIEDRRTGLVVDSADPSELAERIAEVLVSESLAQELGRNGAAVVERRFSIERTASSTLQLMGLG